VAGRVPCVPVAVIPKDQNPGTRGPRRKTENLNPIQPAGNNSSNNK
jgi:hypothetical protein